MATASGKAALQALTTFCDGSDLHVVRDLADLVSSSYQGRSEIRAGGVLSAGGTISASAMQVDLTACDTTLAGKMQAQFAALNDTDLFTTAGSVGQAIYTDGATAAAIALDTDEVARVAVILCNSDGAGGVTDDNGAPLIVAVVAGTAATFAAQTAPPTSAQIQAALEASAGVHAGVTGWVWLGHVVWDENSASPQVTVTKNRNNHLGL